MAQGQQVAFRMFSSAEVSDFTVPFDSIETRLQAVLKEHGCAIVTGVAGEIECEHLESLFAEDLKDLIDHGAAKRSGGWVQSAAEESVENVGALPMQTSKLLGGKDRCQLRGLPHGRFSWACRLLPQVRRCYEVIHETSGLVSSCDNSFFAPGAAQEQRSNRSWPHVDHNSNDKRFYDDDGEVVGNWEVYQGILYIWSSEGSRASTTVVLPGSHREIYESLMQDASLSKRGQKGAHFTQLTCMSNQTLANTIKEQFHAEAGRVPVPRGALFLWSSKLLHQGWSGGPRLAQPVCWEPVGRRDEAALDRKMRLAALGLPSTHWASLAIPHHLVAPEPCTATTAGWRDYDVWLPLKASIHPASLREGANVEDTWARIAGYDWKAPLPEEERKFLAESLAEEILEAL